MQVKHVNAKVGQQKEYIHTHASILETGTRIGWPNS